MTLQIELFVCAMFYLYHRLQCFISKTTMHQTASNLSWIEGIHSTIALSSNHELNKE